MKKYYFVFIIMLLFGDYQNKVVDTQDDNIKERGLFGLEIGISAMAIFVTLMARKYLLKKNTVRFATDKNWANRNFRLYNLKSVDYIEGFTIDDPAKEIPADKRQISLSMMNTLFDNYSIQLTNKCLYYFKGLHEDLLYKIKKSFGLKDNNLYLETLKREDYSEVLKEGLITEEKKMIEDYLNSKEDLVHQMNFCEDLQSYIIHSSHMTKYMIDPRKALFFFITYLENDVKEEEKAAFEIFKDEIMKVIKTKKVQEIDEMKSITKLIFTH